MMEAPKRNSAAKNQPLYMVRSLSNINVGTRMRMMLQNYKKKKKGNCSHILMLNTPIHIKRSRQFLAYAPFLFLLARKHLVCRTKSSQEAGK